MTSERARRANQRNAQASTGPRSLAGKSRSGQNARKHGLSVVDPSPQLEVKVECLAELIAGEHVRDVAIFEAARNIAEAQVQLQRIFAIKTALLRAESRVLEQKQETDGIPLVEISAELLVQLGGLERYESRALSRRKFAVRRFNELLKLTLSSQADLPPGRVSRGSESPR